jgi:Rieske Fe-S protein
MLTPAHLLLSKRHAVEVAGLGLLSLLERRGIVPIADSKEYRLNIAGTLLAAPRYLAPDYLRGQPADTRSDIYSLGVILFEMLRGSPLPDGVYPLEVLMRQEHALPHALHSLLRRALAEDAGMRYQRARDLLIAFARAVEPIPWQRSPVAQPVPIRSSRTIQSNAKRARLPERLGRREVVAVLVGGLVAGMVGTSALASLKPPKASIAVTPSHSGTAIGTMKQRPNTAQAFNMPDETVHRQSLLIHLPDGSFVAYKQGCTHSGVLVTYDSKSQTLICPAHGAIFDSAQGGRVIQGPATRPLPRVAIHINSDGTITA